MRVVIQPVVSAIVKGEPQKPRVVLDYFYFYFNRCSISIKSWLFILVLIFHYLISI